MPLRHRIQAHGYERYILLYRLKSRKVHQDELDLEIIPNLDKTGCP
jgi:hypothetical protein